jgi:hypothetical protein
LEKYVPRILKTKTKKYILEKMYPNFALYSDLETGLRECFSFHELGMIEEMVEPPKKYWNPENVIV